MKSPSEAVPLSDCHKLEGLGHANFTIGFYSVNGIANIFTVLTSDLEFIDLLKVRRDTPHINANRTHIIFNECYVDLKLLDGTVNLFLSLV